MSKKTRSQKIIADLRRKVNLSQRVAPDQLSINDRTPKNNFNYSINRQENQSSKKPAKILISKSKSESELISEELTTYIKKDLFRTLSLSGLVICFLFVLYWTFELNGQQLLNNILPKKLF